MTLGAGAGKGSDGPGAEVAPVPIDVSELASRLEAEGLDATYRRTDGIFFWLLLGQWAFAIAVALILSPRTWAGSTSAVHIHVVAALGLGAIVNAMPLYLIRTRPGAPLTRHLVAFAQMAWSALLIHLTGGRIETHFHIFGSLAFLAFYRDRGVLLTATAVMVADHLVRGITWPQSIYGLSEPDGWRFIEHALWVAFEVAVLLLGIARSLREVRVVAEREAALAAAHAEVERTVAERTLALASSTRRYRELVETTHAVTWEYDPVARRLVYIAPQAGRFFGCDEAELLGGGFLEGFVHPDDRALVRAGLERARDAKAFSSGATRVDFRVITHGTYTRAVRAIFGPPRAGEPLRGVVLDVSEQKRLESELLQAQKLESVGRLATGIAHEINTPVQFVADSVHFVNDAVADLTRVIDTYRNAPSEAPKVEAEVDLGYLREQVPRALARAVEGLARVTTIVRSMRTFAHPDQPELADRDLIQNLEATLAIGSPELKYVADVHTDFRPIPLIRAHMGELNQVFLNVIVNAAHAIAERYGPHGGRGTIVVSTRLDGPDVVVSVKDDGAGIPEVVRNRIFDPFFTTKEVGRGTGQGLSLSRAVVTRHGGSLTFESEVGVGTTFYVRLPVKGPESLRDTARGAAE